MQNLPIASTVVVATLLGLHGVAQAAPDAADARVVAGSASVVNGTDIDTLINQASDKAILEWSDFDIAQGELVRFVQNGADSVALNRITGGDATKILGQLQANGRLFLVNPNGIVFGSTAQVDVAGLVATTLDIDNQAFMEGDYAFEASGQTMGKIRNEGTIRIGDNGFAYLVAPTVDNSGTIVANLGQVGLANNGAYTLDLQGNEMIRFEVSPEVLEASTHGVTQSGSLQGEVVVLSAGGAETVMSSVVNSGDVTAATSLFMAGEHVDQSGQIEAGDIWLLGKETVVQSGDMAATGQVDVDADTRITMAEGTTTRAEGDIRYNVDGEMRVANLYSQSGYIGLVADGNFTQTGDITTEGTSVEVMAGTVAAGGSGSTGDIVMSEGTRTQAVDDIRYTAGRDLTTETLVSQPDDDIELRAGRNLYQNADIVAAGQVDVKAKERIVMAEGTTTQAGGDIRYNVDGDMRVANLASETGYIGLVADSSITQAGNITTGGSSVEVMAGTVAAGGTGDSGDIVMADEARTESVSAIRYTSGHDLTLTTLETDPDDTIELSAGRNLYQNAGIVSAGQVEATAGKGLVMAQGSATSAQEAVVYRAGESLAVSQLDTASQFDGGRIVLEAPSLSSTAGSSGKVTGAFAWVETVSYDEDTLMYLFGEPADFTRIMVNGRMAGGEFAEKNSHFLNSLRTSTGQAASHAGERGMQAVFTSDLGIRFDSRGEEAADFTDSNQAVQ